MHPEILGRPHPGPGQGKCPLALLRQLNQITAGIVQDGSRYRTHGNRQLRKHDPSGAKAFVFSLNIFNRERSEWNTILH